MLNTNSILITGGTGSFGRAFVKDILQNHTEIKRVVVYSRDELKQFEMAQEFPAGKFPELRFFIGDVRDGERLKRALEGIDTVIHAAALKQVPIAEYNPFECIKTNILGAQNLIEGCLDSEVKNVVALSTDKAASPVNLYGATKLCSDKLFIAANNIKGNRNIKFSVVRYGNVMGSRGSVIPFFKKRAKSGSLPITDPRMTRFNIRLEDGVQMVKWAHEHAEGGEIFVPKIPSYRILDLAKAIGPDCDYPNVGMRPGEKIHEEMITASDSINTIDLGDYYAIIPAGGEYSIDEHMKRLGGKRVPSGFVYNSGMNEQFLTVEELKYMCQNDLKLEA